MPRIQLPDLVQRIVRRYGLVGVPGPDTIAPEIVPVAIVDVIEQEVGVGVRYCMGAGTQGASVGKYEIVHLQNPANSGILVEVIGAHVAALGNSGIYGGFSNAALTNSGTNRILDTRWPSQWGISGAASATAKVSYEDLAASGIAAADAVVRTALLAYTCYYFALTGLTLIEGRGFRFHLDQNKGIQVTFYWKESPLERTD